MAALPSVSAPGHELAVLVETGLITPVQQKALALASASLQALGATTPTEKRHFSRIDTRLLVRTSSPVSEARDVLVQFNAAWAGLAGDFHRYRTIFFEARLRRAKLNKKQKEIEGPNLSDDDRVILESEVELEKAHIDALESSVRQGHANLQCEIARAATASERYMAICHREGKESFSEADFKTEEILYFLKSAWWHASQVFTTHDNRDQWARPKAPPKSRSEEYQHLMEARKHRQIDIKNDVSLYFRALNIDDITIKTELEALLKQREVYERSAREHWLPPFAEYFDGWLTQMVSKYKAAAVGAVARNGTQMLERLSTLMDQNAPDVGDKGDIGPMRRATMSE